MNLAYLEVARWWNGGRRRKRLVKRAVFDTVIAAVKLRDREKIRDGMLCLSRLYPMNF